MNTDELRDLLQTLPPPMDGPPDRFARVQRRARRRTRTINVTVGVAAAGVVVAAGVLTTTSSWMQSDGRHDIATDPASPTESVRYEDVGPLPGETTTIELSTPVSATATGTSSVALGSRPDGATAVNVSVVCLSAGRVVYPDGASVVCEGPATASEIADPRSANYGLMDLTPGQSSLKFRAKPDVSWKVVASYVRTETSEWGINAKGETFGVQRDGKSPDLIAAYATNGKHGYVYGKDLDGPMPTSPTDALAQQEANEGRSRSVPVYESDGETIIGEFAITPGVSGVRQ
ncbi:MAG: hypothetical protein WAW88_01265 [Nocardioides sp.]